MKSVPAIVRYHLRTTRRSLILVTSLLGLLLSLNLLIPLIAKRQYVFSNFSDGGVFGIMVIVMMITASHSGTGYFLSRPLARRSVWVGNLVFLVLLALGLAITRLGLALAGYGAVSILSRLRPGDYTFAAPGSWGMFQPGLSGRVALDCFLALLAAGLFSYAYGCLLRRWKAWTIALSVILPTLLIALAVMPTVYLFINDFESLVESGDMTGMMQVLPHWMSVVQRVLLWIDEYFDLLYWSAAALTLPIGFLVMRTTRHT